MAKRKDWGHGSLMSFILSRGKTPEGVAQAINRTQRSIYYWMSGEREPRFTITEMQKLCRYLECSVFDLPESFASMPEVKTKVKR